MRNILFIGDSITDFGMYTSLVDSYINYVGKGNEYNFYNIGLSSENTSGLSEEGHPFPRPNIHSRIDNILEYYRNHNIDTAIILYGVNDAICRPFSQDRFNAYKVGMARLIDKLKAANIDNIFLCTPTYFDNKSCGSKMTTLEEENSSCAQYGTIYYGYDDTMTKYAEWIKLRELDCVTRVIDIHEAMKNFIDGKNKLKDGYNSGDGIHPNFEVATAMACAILNEGFDFPNELQEITEQKAFKKLYKLVFKRDKMLHSYDKEIIGHCSPWKDKFLPKEILDKQVAKLDIKIEKIVAKINTQAK